MKHLILIALTIASTAAAQSANDYLFQKWDGTKFVKDYRTTFPAANTTTGGNGTADSGKIPLLNATGGLNLGKSNTTGVNANLEVHSGSNFAISGMAHLIGGFGFEATLGADGTGGYSFHSNGFSGTGYNFDDTGGVAPSIAVNAYGSTTGWALRAADDNDAAKLGIRMVDGGLYWFGAGSDYQTLTNYTALLPATPSAAATITVPNRTGTLITTGDTGTVTNTMLAGSIANAKLANSSITINGTAVSLGGSTTISTGLTIGSTAITSGTSGRLLGSGTTLSEVIIGSGLTLSAGTLTANVTSVAGRTGAVTLSTSDISGLGTMATQNASNVTITGGSVTGLSALGISGGTVTTSTPLISSTQTWNAPGVNFVADTMTITSTQSASGSLVWERKVGATTVASLRKDGHFQLPVSGTYLEGNAALSGLGLGAATIAQFNGTVSLYQSGQCQMSMGEFAGGFNGLSLLSSARLGFSSSATATYNVWDAFFMRNAAGWLQMGADSATPVAQTFSGSDASGTNVTGGSLTVSSGRGSGSAAGGDLVLSTAGTGSSGSTLNANVTRVTIKGGTGYIILSVPTSSAGLPSGAIWNNSGVLNIVP